VHAEADQAASVLRKAPQYRTVNPSGCTLVVCGVSDVELFLSNQMKHYASSIASVTIIASGIARKHSLWKNVLKSNSLQEFYRTHKFYSTEVRSGFLSPPAETM